MNTLVNLQIERENGDWDADINAYAAQLGGEVHGNKIYAPSPGCAADDRSLVVIFNSATNFFIYGYDGSAGAAYAHVNKVLSLKDNRRPEAERIAEANRIWSQTVSAQGTIVEKYLRSRAITLPVPEVIRFHRSLYHSKSYGIRPAMVARMDDVDGRLVAVHLTWLPADGSGKANVTPQRKTPGKITGAAIRLCQAAVKLCVGEGIETCLSVAQATGLHVWAAGSTFGLKTIQLPPIVRDVTWLADGDEEGKAACRYAMRRLTGRIAQAPEGKDFNDVLIEEAAR